MIYWFSVSKERGLDVSLCLLGTHVLAVATVESNDGLTVATVEGNSRKRRGLRCNSVGTHVLTVATVEGNV